MLVAQGQAVRVPQVANWRACQAFALRHGLFRRGATTWAFDGDGVVDCADLVRLDDNAVVCLEDEDVVCLNDDDGFGHAAAPKRARHE